MSYNNRDINKAFAEPSYKQFADLYYMPEDLESDVSAKLKQKQADINCMVPHEFFDYIAFNTKDEYHDMMQGIADFYRENRCLTYRQVRAVCKATAKLGFKVPEEAMEIKLI